MEKSSLHVIIATYKHSSKLRILIDSFFSNNGNGGFSLAVYNDGEDRIASSIVGGFNKMFCRPTPVIPYHETEKRYNDWGHSLRELGLKNCTASDSDYILFTNGDNYYCPPFVEEMLFMTGPNVGVVYCDMIHSHPRPDSSSGGSYGYFNTTFKPNFCDIGSFIVRLDIARAVGYRHKHRDADASFISDILNYQKTNPFEIVKVNKVLFVHN